MKFNKWILLAIILISTAAFVFTKSCSTPKNTKVIEFTGNETLSELELMINSDNAFIELVERGQIQLTSPINNIQKYAEYISDTLNFDSIMSINSHYDMTEIDSEKLYKLIKNSKRDNRQDFFMVNNNEVRDNFLGVAGIVYSDDIINNQFIITESYRNLKFDIKGEDKLLCTNINFYDQEIAPFCTAFVVSHDLIITAGHCLKNVSLDSIAFVFDLKLGSKNKRISELNIDQIYYPKDLIETKYDPINKIDYAIIELENSVPDERVLSYSLKYNYKIGARNYIIGHPSGLPLKYAPDGFITARPWKNHFQTNLNAFGGNSGSPIFDANTHDVIGIFIAGENKFNYYSDEDCVDIIDCKPRNCSKEIGVKLSKTNLHYYVN